MLKYVAVFYEFYVCSALPNKVNIQNNVKKNMIFAFKQHDLGI